MEPTAVPVWISELLNGSFQEHEEEPSSIVLAEGRIVQRIRISGIAVSTNELVVDDGTGSILIRTFGSQQKINIGEPVLVIGRPRVYNQQSYILGEIIKKIDPKWLEVKKKQQPKGIDFAIATVRSLDKGDGADYNEVLAKIGNEQYIVHLLATGAVFETRPGRLKILE